MERSLRELASLTDAKLKGDPDFVVTGVSDLLHSRSAHISFVSHPSYIYLLEKSKAGAICVSPDIPLIEGKNYLISANPSLTFQKIVLLFFPFESIKSGFQGIHPTAVIHPTAKIGENVCLHPYAIIEKDVSIGARSIIGATAYIGPGVTIGVDSIIYPHVTIRERCLIGDRVIIQPNAVIGSCGFGYVTNKEGVHHKQEQLGIVVIEDDVEIGANTAIDRARFRETRIGCGTKIDNLVQIGHNVEIGSHNLIVSQTGIAGSTKTGHRVVMGGQTGVVGHIELADDTIFAARSGISKSIRDPGIYSGQPAIALKESQRQQIFVRRLEEYAQRVSSLEKEVAEIKKNMRDI